MKFVIHVEESLQNLQAFVFIIPRGRSGGRKLVVILFIYDIMIHK